MALSAENEGVENSTTTAPPSIHDYSCPICLELLLRPITLSCGHQFCRGCWLRVLQGRSVRATAHLTGSVACPFRCEVRPVVPEVDQVLARELEALFGVEPMLECPTLEQCASQAMALQEVEEEGRQARKVNAWAAAGCSLTITPEDAAARAETARVRALGRRYRAEQEKLHREMRRVVATLLTGLPVYPLPVPYVHPESSCSRASCLPLYPLHSLTTPGEAADRANDADRGVLDTYLRAPGHTAIGREFGFAEVFPLLATTQQEDYVRAARADRHRGGARAAGSAPTLRHGVNSVAPSPHGADWRGGTLLRPIHK